MTVRFWLRWIGVNLVFALCHPAVAAGVAVFDPLSKSLLVNAVLFVLPAAGWSAMIGARTRRLGMRLFSAVALSTAAFVFCLASVRLLGLAITATNVLVAIWLVTNIGFALSWRYAGRSGPSQRRSMLPREMALAGVLFAGCYGFYFWGATSVVPHQLDHDLEVQATGFGLINRFEPLLLTDRGGLYYFAHPPLLHFYVGASFLLHGELGELQFYDDVSLGARERRRGRAVAPPAEPVGLFGREGTFEIIADEGAEYLVLPDRGGAAFRVPADRVDTSRIIARYLENPRLIETRTPNIFFAAMTVALLAIWVGRLSRRWWLGALVALAYATSAETFVRSSYGGYFALGGFATIIMLLAADRWRRARLPVLAGAFGALADHKLVFLPIAYGIRRAASRLHEWRTGRSGRLLRLSTVKRLLPPVAAGFGLGTGLFWLYGLTVAPAEFYQDHVREHLVNRVAHINYLGYSGYPSPAGLWRELTEHTGYVLLPVALALICADFIRRRGQVSAWLQSSRGLWFLYIALTAVPFTLVDWRMTKHLVPILLPLHLALAPERRAPAWRVLVPAVTTVPLLLYNAWAVWGLAHDFAGFRVTPDW